MRLEPNKAKNQQIIFDVCKKYNVKSLQLTELHIAMMDDCIEAFKKSFDPYAGEMNARRIAAANEQQELYTINPMTTASIFNEGVEYLLSEINGKKMTL